MAGEAGSSSQKQKQISHCSSVKLFGGMDQRWTARTVRSSLERDTLLSSLSLELWQKEESCEQVLYKPFFWYFNKNKNFLFPHISLNATISSTHNYWPCQIWRCIRHHSRFSVKEEPEWNTQIPPLSVPCVQQFERLHTSLSLCLCFFFFFDFLCEEEPLRVKRSRAEKYNTEEFGRQVWECRSNPRSTPNIHARMTLHTEHTAISGTIKNWFSQ